MKQSIVGSTLLLMLSVAADVSHAAAIFVSYTVSGSPGAYDLDFRVTNDMTAWHQNVYLFGVSLGGFDAADGPPPFLGLGATTLNFAFYGGTNTQYNTDWQADPTQMDLFPGETLSGFIAHVTDPIAPTSVLWFAFSGNEVGFEDEPYIGGENFNGAFTSSNPGFEGIARPASAVPEPASVALLCIGLPVLLQKLSRGRKSVRPEEARTTTSHVGLEEAAHHWS